MYLDVLDGHDGAGKGHVRVDLDDHSVHPIRKDILEVLKGRRGSCRMIQGGNNQRG